jgi:hypothetical protein
MWVMQLSKDKGTERHMPNRDCGVEVRQAFNPLSAFRQVADYKHTFRRKVSAFI